MTGNWSVTAPSRGCSQVTRASLRSSSGIICFEFGVAVGKGHWMPSLMTVFCDMSTARMAEAAAARGVG